MKRILLGLLLALGLPAVLAAEPAWVIDRLYLSIYPEPDNDAQRLDLLQSGDELELLGEERNGFARVETAGGLEGWVNQDFLIDSPPARVRIDAVESERDRLRNQLSERDEEVSRLRDRLSALESERKELMTALSEAEANADGEAEGNEGESAADEAEEAIQEGTASARPVERADAAGGNTADAETVETEANGVVVGMRGAAMGLGGLIIALLLSGLGGWWLRENQIRNRFGGLSL